MTTLDFEVQSNPADLEDRYSASIYNPYPVTIVKGRGNYVFDDCGKAYLDVMTGYSSLSLGHCHPDLIRVAKQQLDTLTLTSRAFNNDVTGPFLEHLHNVTGFDKAILMNTGAEAVETAIKVVRRWASTRPIQLNTIREPEIIVASRNFHGRTTTISSFSSDSESVRGFGPFTTGFRSVLFGDTEDMCNAIGPNTIAVLLEPIQGEAGIIVPPSGYLAAVRHLCDRHGALLILDEVQSGLGRTGKWFAYQHEGIRPDGIVIGKALGGGIVPISAFLTSTDVMAPMTPGSHGSTFGGNPFACAIANEVLTVIEHDGLIGRAQRAGSYLHDQLQALSRDLPQIKEVRGRGLWAGVEFHSDAKPIVRRLLDRGILTKETHGKTIRIAPSFYITDREIDTLIRALGIAINNP